MEHSSSICVGGTWMSRLSRSFPERSFICFQSIIPIFLGSLPIKRFSATVRLGQRFTSWYTVLIPFAWASWGEWLIMALLFPAIWIVPLSNSCTPVNTLISVDLPAPFSPISAWISPLLISRISNTTFCSIFFPPAFYTGLPLIYWKASAKRVSVNHFGIKRAWFINPGFSELWTTLRIVYISSITRLLYVVKN